MAQPVDESRAIESEIFCSKYRRIKTIGKGSFGEALLVRSRADGKRYVAKAIDSAAMTQKEKHDVQNEIRILAAVKHPNIVRYHEHFEDGTLIFIVMEYADGGDLNSRIKEAKRHNPPKPFDPMLAMFWFLQLCMALKYLHDNHILHRDLKTANIFLTSKDVVKLGDFGISTVLQNTTTCARTVCGTPYYFSPELCQSKPYNNKSDVWALGVVFYESLTLQRPFNAKSLKELLKKILVGQYDSIPSTVPSEMRALCSSLLQVNINQRPSINRILECSYVQNALRSFSAHLEKQAERDRKEFQEKHQHASACPSSTPTPDSVPLKRQELAPTAKINEREQMAMLRGMNRERMRAMIAQQAVGAAEVQPEQSTKAVTHCDVDDDDDYIVQKAAIVEQTRGIVGKTNLGGHPEEFGDSPFDFQSQTEIIALANGDMVPANNVRKILEDDMGKDLLNRAVELFNNQMISGMQNMEIQRSLSELLGSKHDCNANAITKLAVWESKEKAVDAL